MSRPKESFNKKEKEKKRQQEKQQKKERMEERKANSKKGKSLDEMMAYLDEDGNIIDSPPDPNRKKTEIKVEDIVIGVAKQNGGKRDNTRIGVLSFFNEQKGFGFINDSRTGDRVFVHINQMMEPLQEGDQVQFETERGDRGPVAVRVKKPDAAE